jgi:hypothetical protein
MSLACACGRVGFDARGVVIDAGADAAPDAGVPCGAIDAVVSQNGAIGLAWTGASYMLLTLDGLAELDSSTGALGTIKPLVPAEAIEYGGQEGLAWSGSELALVWLSATGALELGMTDATATTQLATEQLAAGNAIDPHVVWTGADFVVAWIDTANSRVLFAEITATGQITHNGIIFMDGSPIASVYDLHCDPSSCAAAIFHGGAGGGPSLVVEPLPLGQLSAENALGLPPQGVYVQLVPAASGGFVTETTAAGGTLQALDANDRESGPVVAIPGYLGQGLAFVTGVATGTGARLFAVTNGLPLYAVAIDFTAATQQFGPPLELDALSPTSYSVPAIARGPGRVLFAAPYADGVGNHVLLRQLCM